MLETKAVQGYREENKTRFAIEENKYKAAFVSLDVGAIYAIFTASFLQAVSSKGRIQMIKIRIFNVKYNESTNDSGKCTKF